MIAPGSNVPKWDGRSNAYFLAYTLPLSWLGWTGTGAGDTRNRIYLSSWSGKELPSSQESWNIDVKMDDGKPGTGMVILNIQAGNCTTGSSNDTTTATYDLSATAASCGGLSFTAN